MSIFADASALIAMIADEPERDEISRRLRDEGDGTRLWSAISCWETISGLRSSHKWSTEVARREVEFIAAHFAFQTAMIGEREREIALDAYHRFGKGSGRGARLNMGDCLAYACAKANNARLLYTGDDFAQTDLA